MPNLVFHPSAELTLGLELELQIINPQTQGLVARAKDLIRNIHSSEYNEQIKPEITQSMIEVNSNIHTSPQSLHDDLFKMAYFLVEEGEKLGVRFCGAGTHPLEIWSSHKIFPSPRFKNFSRHNRYLAKRFTVFALHLHIGCKNGDDAIYLTHLLSRYVPHFIALMAASPFYQAVDTGFDSSRLNVVSAFPTSGHMPFVLNWKSFSQYYLKMKNLNIIQSMKDIYWDIRPKPKFGTVEIRVCDTPLTLRQAVMLAAYVQALTRHLLTERFPLTKDLYFVYNYNRFQACRYGFNGNFIDPYSLKQHTIYEDILLTLKAIRPHAKILDTEGYLRKIQSDVQHKENGAAWLRNKYAETKSLEDLVQQQCQLWLDQFYE